MSLVIVEGLDLAGKTTLVNALFDSLSVPMSRSREQLCPDNPVAPLIRNDSPMRPYEVASLRFAAHLWDLRNFRSDAKLHVQDGSWLRFQAEHRQKGLDLPWKDPLVGRPDVAAVVFLTASLHVRQWRFRKARRSFHCDPFTQQADRFYAVEHHLREEARAVAPFLELDTGKLSPTETLSRTRRFLLELGLLAKQAPAPFFGAEAAHQTEQAGNHYRPGTAYPVSGAV